VDIRKFAYSGSSVAWQSNLLSKAYIIAVEMFRGPDHIAIFTSSDKALTPN